MRRRFQCSPLTAARTARVRSTLMKNLGSCGSSRAKCSKALGTGGRRRTQQRGRSLRRGLAAAAARRHHAAAAAAAVVAQSGVEQAEALHVLHALRTPQAARVVGVRPCSVRAPSPSPSPWPASRTCGASAAVTDSSSCGGSVAGGGSCCCTLRATRLQHRRCLVRVRGRGQCQWLVVRGSGRGSVVRVRVSGQGWD